MAENLPARVADFGSFPHSLLRHDMGNKERARLLAVVAAWLSLGSLAPKDVALHILERLRVTLQYFRAQHSRLPTQAEGLTILLTFRMIHELPSDPWGGEYWYDPHSRDAVVGSPGPGGQKGTDDDLVTGLEQSPLHRPGCMGRA